MTFESRPTLTFRCGACGTTVSNLSGTVAVQAVMTTHAGVCPGYPPADAAAQAAA